MPGMSGIEMCRSILSSHPSLPVIIITARPDPELEDRAFASGATCFFRKPVDTKALAACLQKALA
jgi:CheY-like chemotaxis protein